jgi:hypothetical protein
LPAFPCFGENIRENEFDLQGKTVAEQGKIPRKQATNMAPMNPSPEGLGLQFSNTYQCDKSELLPGLTHFYVGSGSLQVTSDVKFPALK